MIRLKKVTNLVGVAALCVVAGLAGCGEQVDTSKYVMEPEEEEAPEMMVVNQLDDVPPDAAAPAPPDGMAPPPGTVGGPERPADNDLLGFAKESDSGKDLPVTVALQNACEAYLRLRPTSSQEEGQPQWPPLTNVNLLVRVGLIRGVPAPPAGKQWHIEKNEVSLIDAN